VPGALPFWLSTDAVSELALAVMPGRARVKLWVAPLAAPVVWSGTDRLNEVLPAAPAVPF